MKNVNKSNANFISFQSFAESAGLKKLFSLLLLAAVMFAANAQNPFAQWTDIYTPISNLRYNKIAFDNSGNVITAATGTNVVVIKYNTAGTIQWTTTVTGLSPQRLNKMKTDASGNIYLAGSNTLNNNDAFTIKINNAGVLQWTQTYNGIYGGSDEANSLAIDGTGNVYVAGFASNGPSYNNALLIKYNSAGVLQWVQDCCPNALSQNFNDVAIAPNGNIYATGSGLSANGGGYNGDIFVRGFSPAGGALAPAVNFVTGSPFPMNDYGIRILADASSNIFVYGTNNNTATLIKYNSVGTYQWTYNIPSNSLSKEIVTDASGNFYIVAKQSADSKPVVAKVNSSGVEQWNSIYTYAGSIGYNVSSIAIDASQNVYIFGTVNDDYMLVKYNSAGNFQWEKSYNGSQNAYDAGNAMIAETGGNVYVTGTANQGQVNEYQTTIKYVDISISTSSISTPICPNTIISVPYTISGTYTAGNTFSAELSDNTGSFASPVLIGTLNSTTAGTINALIPSPTPAGSGYRIRVVSSNPAITGSQNSNGHLTINAASNPSVSIAITSGTNNGCATNSISFTATPTNGGSPTYQWKMNGINVGSNSPTYTNASWANGDVVNCVMMATGNCLQPNPVYSNAIIVTTENTTANSWQQKADLGFTQANGPTARYGSVSFSIGNKGYIGTGADGGYKNDFWEYDPGSNTWTQKANFGGTARVRATGFSIGSKGYIGTGEDVGGYKNDFWEYEPAGNSWTQKANFGGTARVDALGFSIGSKGYIGTGADGGGYRNDFWEFDPAGNIWTQKANFGGTARFLATGFSIGSKGYIGTGADGGGYRNDFWEYEPAGNTWTQKANFGGTARASAIGFGIDSKGYIGTGEDVGGRKTDFWEYDPSVNSWTQKANFGGTARVRATGFSIGSRGYIGIGQDVGGSKNDFWEYTPAVNNWTQKANFGGTVRTYTTSFSIGSKGYIGTGYDGTAYTNDFWEYDPAVNTWTQKANFGGTARVLASGFSIGSRGYIGTGEDGGGSKNDFWEYDPSVNSWTQKANFGGTGRRSATGFSIGSKGYIGTGYDNTYTNDFWEYDPSLDIWTQKANFGGTGRRSATGFSIGSKGYIGTGYDNTYKHDFWEYDPSLNTWTQKANFGGTARYFSTGFSIGSKGYIGTGHDITNTNRNDFWEYDPSLNTWIQKANFGGTARNYATGFSIGSKGYIGTGLSDIGPYYYTNGLWEYTPDYSISTGAVYSPLCAGAAISVPYTFTVPTMACGATPNFTFVAQLSNAVGSFVSPINIGSTVANGSGTINATIPANTAGGVLYRVRVIIVSPSVIGSDNGADVTINVAPIATTVSTGGLNVCAGQTNLYGVSAPGATNYTWSLTPPIAGVLTPNGVSALVDWSAAYSGTATLSCVPSNTCGNGTASNFVVTVNSTHGVSIAAYPYQGTFGGKHYYLSNTTATWSAAKIAAEGQCTNLVAVSSGTEQTYVGNILNTTSRWLGGTDEISEGTFRWVNGEPDFATYSNWYTGEPNNGGGNEDDMEMRTNTTFTNKWGDATGGVLQRFILERTDNESLSIVSISDSVLCANSTFNATFSNTGVYDIGNSFKVELSNNTGAFTTSTIIGTQTASSVGTINCTIPNGTANGSGYRIRLISSSPADTLVLTTTFVVGPLSASSTLTGDPFIRCNGPGTSVYSASPVTHALSYTWSISPTTAGTIATAANSVTVTWASAFSGMATLTVTANSGCAASSPATFNIASLPWQSSTEFTETMGSVAASTPVAAYETANGFDNAAYTMSASSAVVVNNTNNSSGYAGASGGANVQIPVSSTLSSRSFIIDGINTIGKNNLVLRLGVRYTSIFSSFSVAASTDGVTYTTLNRSYTEPSANWKEVVVVSGIPQTANLRLRFSGSIFIGSTLYVDDIRLSYNNSSTPTITAAGPTSFCSGDSVQLRPSVSYTGYLWSNGVNTQVITASTAGTYNMQAIDNYGCPSALSNSIIITTTPTSTWYLDADNDNYSTGSPVTQCTSPGAGYKTSGLIAGGDCNDANAAINPGATEITCNGIDENCNGMADDDAVAPVITVPSNIVTSAASGSCTKVVTYTTPTATDNCSVAVAVNQTFNYTGAAQPWTVPAGVNSITYDVRGAQGGYGYPSFSGGGYGGQITGNLLVTPGQVLNIYVGGVGANGISTSSVGGIGGFNGGGNGASSYPGYGNYIGGGGGGASDIRSSPYALANRIVVAGGGGGGAHNNYSTNYERGGGGGGINGETGYGGGSSGGQGSGTGGTQTAGGIGGSFTGYCTGNNGALGTGGNGGPCNNSGGGGGGGYYGGGGGTWSGGGGGSSFPATGVTHTQGFQTGNGQVIISWNQNSNPTVVQTAGLPSGSAFPVGITTNTFTSTDGNGNVGTNSFTVTVNTTDVWYMDADNDGYYVSSTTACSSPGVGYNQTATILGDCDDNDNTKWQSATLYVDVDNDNYDNGTATVCYGASIPAGYKTTTFGSDCNDNDATKYATFSFYADTDGDGYGAGSLVNNICAVNGTSPPSGYATNNTDCAPSDPTKWQNAILYIDNDNDGYDNGTATVCYGAGIPSGYKATTLGSDCNDTNALLNLSCGTSTWLGNTTQWSDPTNWSSGLVPNSCSEDVLIPTSPTGGLFPLIDLAPFTVGNIEVQQGATLTLDNVGQLFVCGDFIGGASTAAKITGTNGKVTLQGTGAQTVTGKVDFSTLIVNSGVGTYTNSGTITIAKMYVPLSGAFTNSGSMTFLSTSPTDIATIDLTTGNIGTLTGNIVAQRYVPVSGSNQHYVSSPVNNLPLSQLGASGTAGYVVPTGTCDETVLASGSPYGNVFRYNEANGASCSLAGWEVVTSGNAENARGYSAYLTGAGAISVTGTANMDFNYAKGANTNSGWTNTTLQGRTQNSGWTLVGNPYLSTINLSDKTAAGFDNQAQVWQTSGPYIGTYQPLTMGGGSALVAPFQGFMVHKTAVGGSSTFGVTRNECVNSTATFYKTGNGNGSLSLKVSGNGFNDITKLTFDDQATNQFDIAIDANKLSGRLTQPMIATMVNSVSYSINNLESISSNPTVPVEFMAGTNGNYTITVDDISTFDPTVMIYLEDKVTNAPWIDLRQNNVYSFVGTTTQTKDRFAIHFSPAAFAATFAADCNTLGSIELEQEGNTAWIVSVKEVATATIKATAPLTSTSPMTIAGLQTGDYEVTMVHSSGYTVVKNLTISGSNPVSASFLCSNYWPIVGQSIIFSSTVNQTVANINWDFGDGNTSSLTEPTHVYTSQGTYNVTMTASNDQGCRDSSSKSITVTAISTGIENSDKTNEVCFFVKENNKIAIRFFGYKGSTANIGIYNVLGQELHFGNYSTETGFEYIAASEMYQYVFVKVIIGDKTILKKLTLGCN